MPNNRFDSIFGEECLRVYSSNSLQTLAGQLADLLINDPLPPLEQEIVLTQNPVMGRWLYLELAKINGACANIRVTLPNAYMHELFASIIPPMENEEQSPFSPWAMTWRIMDALARFMEEPPFTEIQRYLQDDPDGRKRFGLSRRIAGVFDGYLLFRPEMILNWDRGKGEHWQAILWREISQGFNNRHRPGLRNAFFKALGSGKPKPGVLPKRISLFGVWGMPPFHLDVFSGVGRMLPVYLFHVNPCKEYWAHAFSDKQITRITTRSPFTRPEELYLEKGNALLASLGGVGRDFLGLVAGLECHPQELYESPDRTSLLGMIQGEILEFKEEDGRKAQEKARTRPGDRSLAIHNCHSPMREMEVLYDHILKFLDEDPDLDPRDIMVMAPDMDKFAPYVEAVFASPGPGGIRLPYCIAHKEIRTVSPSVNAFLEIFDLCQSRFEAAAVLDLAGMPAVAEKFSFSEQDLETLARWVARTRVRWGANADSRKALGLPATGDNTWESGLDRLMLGYAMSGLDEEFFQGISPFGDLAMEDAPLLGRFAKFTEALFQLSQKMEKSREILEWAEILEGVLQEFLSPDAEDLHLLQIALSKTSKAQSEQGYGRKVSAAVVKAAVAGLLEQSSPSGGILRRGVNFCSIAQGAGIPAKVICLVGMDDGAFPRQDGGMGFDYMARSPRRGDRSPRGDDRFSFLQAIINAQSRLHISFTGQGIQDNAALCPSPLVSELIDYVEAGFDLSGSGPIAAVHKLQPFSPNYFSGQCPGLFSYSKQYSRAADILQRGEKQSRQFFSQPLEAPEAQDKTISLEALCGFFRMPAKSILKDRVGVFLDEYTEAMDSAEAFSLGGLERHVLAGKMVEKRVQGRSSLDLYALAKAQGELPHGNVGAFAFNQLENQISPFARKAEAMLSEANQRLDAHVMAGEWKIHGRLAPLGPWGLILHRTASAKAFDRLNAWIRHLFLCAVRPGFENQSLFAGTDAIYYYNNVEQKEAVTRLAVLAGVYDKGMEFPAPFFPEASFAYAQSMFKTDDVGQAMKAARSKWGPDFFGRGEALDSYAALCFEGRDPLSREFRDLAVEIYAPMLECERKGGR